MSEIISTGIVCPSCGRKGATIERIFSEGAFKVIFKHHYCGYNRPFIDYIKDRLSPSNGDTIVNRGGILNRKLLVTSPHPDTSFDINSLLHTTNGYFQKIHFTLTGLLHERNCPLCRNHSFGTQKNKVVCTNGDFEIPAFLFFQSFIMDPFKIEEKKNTLEHTFEIKCDNPSDLYIHHYLHLTEIVYRYDLDSNHNILIFDPPVNRSDQYRELLKQVEEITHPFFKVIEKIHPKN
jgi:hypothetical protein